jgi:mannose-1-phosphate guanylyltransferase/mannose-6-phosphate isomerase
MVYDSSSRIEENVIKVLILAGGGGTRLWPLSTEENPKQFIYLPAMTESLFQITLKRALLFCDASDLIVVTSKKYQSLVFEQANKIGIALTDEQVFLESKRLNTLLAIIAGLVYAKTREDEEVLVFPSDHILDNEQSLVDAVDSARPYLNSNICVFGVIPHYPHTGYGYIQPAEILSSNVNQVKAFKEKPDVETATSYLKQSYLWNAGIFYFNYGNFKSSVSQYQPEMAKHFFSNENTQKAFEEWSEGISIDYGLLEKTTNIIVSKIESGWTDVGSFDSLIEYLEIQQPLLQEIQGKGSVLITDEYINTVVIGLEDLIIVQSKNGNLICKRGKSQLVANLSEKKANI